MAPAKRRGRAGQPACISGVTWSHFLTARGLAFQPGHRGGPEPEGRVSLPKRASSPTRPKPSTGATRRELICDKPGRNPAPRPRPSLRPRFPSSATATQSQSQRPGKSELRWCDLLHTTRFPGHSHREQEHLHGVLAARSPLCKLPHGFWGWEM